MLTEICNYLDSPNPKTEIDLELAISTTISTNTDPFWSLCAANMLYIATIDIQEHPYSYSIYPNEAIQQRLNEMTRIDLETLHKPPHKDTLTETRQRYNERLHVLTALLDTQRFKDVTRDVAFSMIAV